MSWFRRRRRSPEPADPGDQPAPPIDADSRAFGYKLQWLALGLGDVRSVAWAEGVAAVYTADASTRPAPVFVTPPVDGWVFAPHDYAAGTAFDLGRLSSTFGEAHRDGDRRAVERQPADAGRPGRPAGRGMARARVTRSHR